LAPALTRTELRAINRRLRAAFGPQHWWPADTPFEVMVGAILTQNTAWTNVEKAIANLKAERVLTPARLLALPHARLARLIRPAGYYNVKARRLASFIEWLADSGGLASLARVPTNDLRPRLLAVNGIGPETADSILLYALNRPVFPIDAYTRRILSRYGLIQGDEPYDDLRIAVEHSLGPDVQRLNEFHALLVRLAKTHCLSRPVCSSCPLS
jgi:endonuclease-3 related protein